MLNFNNQPGTLSAEKSGGAIQRSASFLKRLLIVTLFCALSFMLSAPSLVQAEDLQEGTPAEQPSTNVQPVDTAAPTKLITSAAPENKAPAKAHTQAGDGLEIGPEIIGQPVRAVKPPTVNIVSPGDKTVSGKLTIGAGQRKSRKLDVTIRVIVNRQAGGTEEKTVTIPYGDKSQDWTVTLDSELAEGDKVTVTQEAGGEISGGVVREVKKPLSDQHKDDLKMPTGEIWIEQTSSNQVSVDEHAEAIEMLKNANPDIAKDFKEVKFSIDGTDHAYYEVTYTDKSTSGKIEAKDLKIKTVTEKSAAPTIEKVQVTDRQIIVTLDKEVAAGTKFYFVKNFTDGEDKNFGEGGKCIVDKSTSQEMSQAVSVDGKKVTFPIKDDDIELGKEFGILVKEPHKFRSCAKSEPVVTTPKKVAVRDPHKLTDADKKAIDKAIRDANTVNGTSKLPDGTGYITDPAFIEFDKDGNVTIISPNDVETDWDSSGNPIYVKNPDGTYKVNDGAKVTKFPAKDLVKNIAPKSPGIAVDTDKGEVTITPPAYKDPGDDTDLISYTVSYNDDKGKNQSVTVTRDLKTNKWSGTGVDENTGVITLKVEDIEVGGTIKAIAKDNGGLEGDKKKLDSEEKTQTLETATVSYNANKGDGKMDGKKLNKGSKYKILANKFRAPDENQEFKAWEVDGKEVAPGTEITVKDNTVVKAVWKKIKVNVTYDGNGGKGSMDGATVDKGSKYTVLPNGFTAPDENQEFKAWEVDGKEVAPGTEITVKDNTVVKAIWKDIEYKVNFDGNGGSGDMKGKTVKQGATVELPANGFTPPSGKEFNGWQINGKSYKVGESITVNGDVTVKALWKNKPVPPSTTPGKDKPGKQGKSQPQNPAAGGNLSKTGANGMYSLYASLLLLATGGLFVISRRRRAQR
ncbi:InlB B-repeat-containing protein [Varibaculum cambriense]|uniref:InlB B-repeat-containing protein n=1 Tax=Varibaculum cambriense TaxID=184870 RepID=UPI00255415E4|nr:InlB B-repeat-containing protein [Varibaculum cambriense]MDK8274001.1 InlB B-repeat-containing protein [Varibaculum cambriense]